jgi:hypothetical protein
MNKRLIAVTFLFCLVSFMVVGTARGQTVTPGVNPGDGYVYISYSHWTSSDPYSSIPQDLLAVNQTSSFEVRISDANDTDVTTFTAIYYYDGTADAKRGDTNVQTGATTDGGFAAIIGANLTAGDLIHPLGADGITINQTGSMNGRSTNQIYISYYDETTGNTSSVDRYFDMQTGMLVQETDSSVDDGSVSGTTSTSIVTIQLKSTTVWTVPEFPSVLILPLFMIAALLAVIAYKKKRASITKTLIPANTRKF